MKNLKNILTALLLLCCTAIQAQEFYVGDMSFEVLSENNKTVKLSSIYDAEVLNIPAQVTYEGETYSVVSISRVAFSYSYDKITTIIIPASITNIDSYAFVGCHNVTTILTLATTAPTVDGTIFGYGAYSANPLLLHPTNSDYSSWKSFCSEMHAVDITHDFCVDGLFYTITDQENKTVSLTTPHNDSEADYFTMVGMYSGDINIPSSVVHNNVEYTVTGINNNTFRNCEGVTSISVPATINSITEAFSTGSKLMSITVDENNPVYDSRDNCNAVIETATNKLITACNSTIIPESVTSIGNDAFRNCRSLESIHIPASVIEIKNNNPFIECPSLNSITVDEKNPVYDSRDNCNAVIKTTYNAIIVGCHNTVIPNSVNAISSYAFNYCEKLRSFEIPNYVTHLGFGAFYGCSNLTSIIIPNSISYIQMWTFEGCKSLTSITIPSSVEGIEGSAFTGCTSLKSITSLIPAEKLFSTFIHSNTFNGVNKNSCTLYVPFGAKETYAATSGWKDFKNIVELEEPVVITGTCGENAYWTLDEKTGTLTISGEGYIYANKTYPWKEHKDNIYRLKILDGITNIPSEAFAYFDKLREIEIPASVTKIGGEKSSLGAYGTYYKVPIYYSYTPFIGCINLEKITVNPNNSVYYSENNAIIEKSTRTLIVGCKETVIGNDIRTIGACAFMQCGDMKSVNIPYGVEIIEYCAFNQISSLEQVTIPNSVKSIGHGAFTSTKCTNFTIPSSVKVIEGNAFYNTGWYNAQPDGLLIIDNCIVDYKGENKPTSLNIDKNIRLIVPGYHFGNLEHITVDSNNPYFCSPENSNVVIDRESNTLIVGSKNSIIPSEVTTIGECAFSYSNISKIDIPDGTTTIERCAFYGCRATEITIPNSVTSIGEAAFERSYNLKSITISNNLTKIDDLVFYMCSDLESIEIPDGITEIGYSSFCGCSSLTNITIPNSVTKIGSYAFGSCSNLESITSLIPAEKLSVPGENAFNRIDKDACTLYVPYGAKSTYATTEGWNEFKNIVELTDEDRQCGDEAYWAFDEETGTLTISGKGAMYDYYAGSDATAFTVAPWYILKENIRKVVIGENITHIGECAFDDCTQLADVTLPNSLKSIGEYAFADCAIYNIVIPQGVTSIGKGVFAGCNNLEHISVSEGNSTYSSPAGSNVIIENSTKTLVAGCKNSVIPNTVKIIGYSALHSLSSLTSIEIPNSVTTIGDYAFHGCASLTSITIPSSVTYIGVHAFYGCASLRSITSLIPANKLFYLSIIVFYGVDKNNCTLYVPAGAKEKYAATSYWNEFNNIVEAQTITINQYGSATYCSPYTLDFSNVQGLKAYAATGYKSSTKVVTLTRVQTAGAGVGLFLKGEPGEYIVPIIESTDEHSLNMLVGTLEPTIVNSTDGGMTNFKYTIKSGDETPLFYQFEDNSTLSAGKAYLQIPTAWLPATAQKSVNICFDEGETTDIDKVEDENCESKTVYDLQGRAVKSPTSGIYIINGRKVFIK